MRQQDVAIGSGVEIDSTVFDILSRFEENAIDLDTAYRELVSYVDMQVEQQDRLTRSYMSNENNSLRGTIRKLRTELEETKRNGRTNY